MQTTAIIDYDAGNIRSVEKAIRYLGKDAVVTADRETILSADRVILPGVGAFGDAMGRLHALGLTEVIRQTVEQKHPVSSGSAWACSFCLSEAKRVRAFPAWAF